MLPPDTLELNKFYQLVVRTNDEIVPLHIYLGLVTRSIKRIDIIRKTERIRQIIEE